MTSNALTFSLDLRGTLVRRPTIVNWCLTDSELLPTALEALR
jgi:hypothetical protein